MRPPLRCCNASDALTLGRLRLLWADRDDATPVLVSHGPNDADWAQDADVIATEAGLLVARLSAPWAKQSQPPPGTIWTPATPIPPGSSPHSPTAADSGPPMSQR